MKCLKGATAALAVLGLCALFGPAAAFGTIVGLGQNAEHERITRVALACPAPDVDACWHGAALAALAGQEGRPGAVGIADRSALVASPRAHCDDGDVLDRPGYPQATAAAHQRLTDCRDWMALQLDRAVRDAARLVDARDGLSGDLKLDGCFRYILPRTGARCAVIADLGLLLHTAQDFYAHTNWVDRPDPARPLSLTNPPGLGESRSAPFIGLRGAVPATPPPGLISGCFNTTLNPWFCRGRVTHADLNKDEGPIQPVLGVGTTPRGRVQGNFARAVRAATWDTQDKWALFQERLAGRYGAARAQRMICVLTADAPQAECRAP